MATQSFGARLRELRKRAGLSQRELARRVGIDFTYLSKIESGAMPPPSEKILSRLADALNVGREELQIIAGKLPDDIAERLMDSETIKRLRSMGNKVKESNINRGWSSTMKSMIHLKSFAKVAVAFILSKAILASLTGYIDLSIPNVNLHNW